MRWIFGHSLTIKASRVLRAGRLGHRLHGRDLGRHLGLLLVIVDQMDEGLDQVVVDLPEAMRGKAQKI